jgi:putative ABC transport system ATP-binding protein
MSTNPNGGTPLITMTDISKTYVNAAGAFTALKHINLDFYEGEYVGVIGKSGSGKSTMVNMITGIDRPTEGKVVVGGTDIHAMPESRQARWRGLNLGVVFQFFQLLPMLTLIENVLLPMDFCEKYSETERVKRAMDLLDLVGLADEAYKLPGAVSGGQQQSAAIARSLANDPPIIVADEPTGNLDTHTADSVYALFASLAEEGRTIIMITHDPEIESRLSRKVLISDGEIIDPALANSLEFLPHPSLLKCNPALTRKVFQPGESLDLAGELMDQLVFIETGKLGLNLQIKNQPGNQLVLQAGDFLGGGHVIHHEKLPKIKARVIGQPVQVALLPFSVLYTAVGHRLDLQPLIIQHFLRQLREGKPSQASEKGQTL